MTHPAVSLRWKLAGLLAALALLLAFALAVAVPRVLASHARAGLESRALAMATMLAGTMGPPLDFGDAADARVQLDAFFATRGATYAVVTRPDGTVLAARGAERVPPDAPTTAAEPTAHAGGTAVHAVAPVLSPRGRPRGTVYVGIGLSELDAQRRETLRAVAVALVLFAALGVGGALVIGAVFAAPIRRVTAIASRIASGDLDARQRLDVDRRDETGRMAQAVSAMVGRLIDANQQLETRVAERTAELARANAALRGHLDELRTTQDRLVVAERRAAIGRLAAGVAHEINNPLAYVVANLQFVRDDAPPPDEARAALDEALSGCERVRHIVQGLKTSATADQDELDRVDLPAVVTSALRMCEHELTQRARLTVSLGPAPVVTGNAIRLGQVVLNLLINAVHALGDGAADSNEVRVATGTSAAGEARVVVADTGCGMEPELLRHIFDPFFTTKPVGAGTGLGLHICDGIVRSMGGRIEVVSAPGEGTTFTVLLPPAAGTDAVRALPARAADGARGPRRRVLVVDDDELVLRSIRRTLAREHDVELASSGGDAVSRLASGAFDVVVCDLMMPGMTGMDLHAWAATHSPALARRMLFMTGGTFTDASTEFEERHRHRILPKPLDPAALRTRIRSLAA